MIVRGYQAFLEFEQAVYDGAAQEGMVIELFPSDREEFDHENDWVDNNLKIYYSAMRQIAKLIECGRLPDRTTIKLYISNYANQDFKYIADALKSGKCPADFKLIIYFDFSSRKARDRYAKEAFLKYWIPQLADALESGQCPAGLDIELRHPELSHPMNNKMHARLNQAKAVYHQLLAQQQTVALVQGANQPDSDLGRLPKEVISLICCFLIRPASMPLNVVAQYQDKLMEISASCFLDHYWSFYSSSLSQLFKTALQQILGADLSVRQKAEKIRRSAGLFLDSSLSGLENAEYKKTEAVKLACKYRLFEPQRVQENPESSGEFRLNPEFGRR
ncbi:hypothetical protein AQUSIP_21590 [Aquicella siphonis]|uniref:Uncharacterized protein n=1 Tax=Aquicella siphonis TaxID=254247 RepID=A0A5E4PKQ7_9COXI|nr:hypothetical protein [Aquicella siphonis]VVC76832.1 hypothetical protein AQUSIP_21590 [Aquicella siphonis]